MADAIGEAGDVAFDVAGAVERHALGCRIVEQQALRLRDNRTECLRDFVGAGGIAREGCCQEELGVAGVRKNFDLAQALAAFLPRPRRRAGRACLQKQRRKDGALINSAERGGIRSKVPEGQLFGFASGGTAVLLGIVQATNLPLRAVAIAPGRRGVRGDVARPVDAAEAAQSFAENVGFVAQLGLVRNVLVVAAAADAEMRAGRRRRDPGKAR